MVQRKRTLYSFYQSGSISIYLYAVGEKELCQEALIFFVYPFLARTSSDQY